MSLQQSMTGLKLTRWLRPLAFPFDDKSPRAASLEVKHTNVNEKNTPLRKMGLPEEIDEDKLRLVVDELEALLQDDADGIGGVQRYMVVAKDEAGENFARLSLRVAAAYQEGDPEGDELSSEPANAKGMVAAAMRHTDAAYRAMGGSIGMIIQTQQRTISRLSEQNEKLAGKAMDVLTHTEELLSRKHERDLELEEERGKQRRKGEFVAQIQAMVPAVMQKLTGIAAPTGPDDAFNVQTLKAVAESITEEQFDALKGVLTPAQFFALASLMEKVSANKGEDAGSNGTTQ